MGWCLDSVCFVEGSPSGVRLQSLAPYLSTDYYVERVPTFLSHSVVETISHNLENRIGEIWDLLHLLDTVLSWILNNPRDAIFALSSLHFRISAELLISALLAQGLRIHPSKLPFQITPNDLYYRFSR